MEVVVHRHVNRVESIESQKRKTDGEIRASYVAPSVGDYLNSPNRHPLEIRAKFFLADFHMIVHKGGSREEYVITGVKTMPDGRDCKGDCC